MGVFLEDEFDENPKVVLAGEKAAWMYVRGLLYCRRNPKTSGRIHKNKVPELTKLADPRKLALRLVEAGLWEDEGDHFHVHDFEVHNQSAEVRRVELDVQQEARREHARKAANARHHGPKSGKNEQESSTDRASDEQTGSSARAVPEQVPGDASRGRGRAPDPDPVPIDPSPPEDLVGVLNGCSPSAHDDAHPDAQALLTSREKERDQEEPQVNDPMTERWLAMWPNQQQEAKDVLALCVLHIESTLVDEAIGHVKKKRTARSPRYLLATAASWANQRGANLSETSMAALVGRTNR